MALADGPAGWVGLSLIPGLGGETFRRLLRAFGEPRHIWAAGQAALAEVAKPAVAARIRAGLDEAAVQPTLDWLGKAGNHLLTLADEDYPRLLLQVADPPPFLYLKGRRELLQTPALAVVGSRNATVQGLRDAQSFSHSLSEAGLCIVSGMAGGIDAAAHRGGLDGGSASIAVVGTGLDIVYPSRNHALAHELAERGLLVSEFVLGTPAVAANFPRRNRIISGLALGCLVVEAAPRSGSLITARLAAEQGREVFAIPGSIHAPQSRGCHALIKQGAKLVECADDILGELQFQSSPAADEPPAEPPEAGDPTTARLLAAMAYDPVDTDTLVERSGLTSPEVSAMLLTLELDGKVASLPGGKFQRLA